MNDDAPLRREALDILQIAELSSVLAAVQLVADAVNRIQPSAPPLDVDAVFLRTRKELVHQLLEQTESTNPEKAAQLQAILDKYCTRYPLDYD